MKDNPSFEEEIVLSFGTGRSFPACPTLGGEKPWERSWFVTSRNVRLP